MNGKVYKRVSAELPGGRQIDTLTLLTQSERLAQLQIRSKYLASLLHGENTRYEVRKTAYRYLKIQRLTSALLTIEHEIEDVTFLIALIEYIFNS